MSNMILEGQGLRKEFGGLVAVADVTSGSKRAICIPSLAPTAQAKQPYSTY